MRHKPYSVQINKSSMFEVKSFVAVVRSPFLIIFCCCLIAYQSYYIAILTSPSSTTKNHQHPEEFTIVHSPLNKESTTAPIQKSSIKSIKRSIRSYGRPPDRILPYDNHPTRIITIKSIYLLGERNSGTNFLNIVLSKAFRSYSKGRMGQQFQAEIPVLKYKHMFRHSVMNEEELQTFRKQSVDSLYMLMVRDPCGWALSMKTKPWHLCPPNDPKRCARNATRIESEYSTLTIPMSNSEFFQMPWRDWGELHMSGWTVDQTYRNIFELRATKLRIMQQVRDALPNRVHIVHHRDFEAASGRVVNEIEEGYGLRIDRLYRPDPATKLHRLPCLTKEEQALATKYIDWELEKEFGFLPDQCRICASTMDTVSKSLTRGK